MKFTKSFLATFLIIAFTACSNDNELGSDQTSEIRSVSVTLNLPRDNDTKVSAPVDVITSNTIDVNSVLINLMDAGDTVIESLLVAKDTDIDSDWTKLTNGEGLKFINTPSSVARVEIYGNPGNAVNSYNVVATTIEEQQGSAVLYYGYDDDLTPIVTEPVDPDPTSGSTYTANITITPIVARLQVKSISFKNSGEFEYSRTIDNKLETAIVTWDSFSANVVGIYFNNFYYGYNKPGTLTDLMNNLSYQNTIYDGLWSFPSFSPTKEASSYAAYIDYADGVYSNLPLSTSGKAYAFNFFPGSAIPTMHIDLKGVSIGNLQSTNDEVFNPAIVNISRFANISVYYKNTVTEMVASDFTAGIIYNMDVEIIPALDTDLKNMQYNVLVYVTIAPWVEETLIPGFDLSE